MTIVTPNPAEEGVCAKTKFGISAALITPFDASERFLPAAASRHAAHVMQAGANGITLCGTNGEGASVGLEDRKALIAAVLSAGLKPAELTLCLCSSSLEGALAQARQGLEQGISRFLVTPPFYFKGVSDQRLVDWYEALIAALGSAAFDVILYHIPQVTSVPISLDLVRRLMTDFPTRIYGVKDSSGNWESAKAFMGLANLHVMIGDERLLAPAAPLGCSGSICGLANLVPSRVVAAHKSGVSDKGLDALVTAIVQSSGAAMVKALAARMWDDPDLERTRAPSPRADPDEANRIFAEYLEPLLEEDKLLLHSA